jgi:hypothetical protein
VPVTVEVDQRASGVLNAIEPEPAELPSLIGRYSPRPRSVIGEVRLGCAVIVEVEHHVIGDAVTIEIRECVVVQPVAVEVQPKSVEPSVAIKVEVKLAVPDSRRTVVSTHAVVHKRSDA